MPARVRARSRAWLVLLAPGLLLAAGCVEPEGPTIDDRFAQLEALAPVSGVVTAGGKPVAGVVVTFLPRDWGPAHGETDAEGRFTLQTASRPGALPGEYKVALSLLVAENGRVLGLGPRSSLTPDPDMENAREQLPDSVCSFEKTTLTASVPPEGGQFPFEIGTLPPGPKTGPTDEASPSPKPDADEAAEVEAEAP